MGDFGSIEDIDNIEDDKSSLFSDFNDICLELNNIKSIVSSLTNKLKVYKKKIDIILKEKGIENKENKEKKENKVKKEVKSKEEKKDVKEKVKKERKKKEEIIPPSAITSPTLITPELQYFLGKEDGCLVTRLEITNKLYEYIKINNLQNFENKKIINPDDKLKKLFNLSDNQELTYFNIQSMINKHFIIEKKYEKEEEDVGEAE
jgi:chromatin remodeling complex protein RSC6